MGSSESKAKCSFGQKEFYLSNMGETAFEDPDWARDIMSDFSKNKSSSNFRREIAYEVCISIF